MAPASAPSTLPPERAVADRRVERADVDRGRLRVPQPERAEHVNEPHRRAVRAGGDHVRDLAGDAAAAPAHLAVADDRAAEPLAEVEVDDVRPAPVPAASRSARAAQLTSLSTTTGPSHDLGQQVGRGQLAEQERRVGQVHQPPVARSTGSAALTMASRTGDGACPATSRPTSWTALATCRGRAGRVTAASPRASTRPRASTTSATTPSGATLIASAHPTSPARA